MTRPLLEIADLIRTAGAAFIERNHQWIRWRHVKVLLAIARCRTAALGGHLDQCTRCGHRATSYNSCRNRYCPKCQIAARERWIAARRRELLPQYVSGFFFAEAYVGLGQKDQAVTWLERAYNEHDRWMVYIASNPGLDRLHSEPRFQALLRRMNFPQ